MQQIYSNNIILGGAQLGLRYGITNGHFLSRSELYEILDKATYLGLHRWDLAQAYGGAESRVAQWYRNRNCRTNRQLQIGSKLHISLPLAERQYERLRRRVQHSRALLGKLDYLLLHSVQTEQPQQQLEQLQRLAESAGARRFGVSLYYPAELEKLMSSIACGVIPLPQIVQLPYSIVDRRFESYFFQLQEMGVELQLRSLYLQGLLFENETKIPAYSRQFAMPHLLNELRPILNTLGDIELNHSQLYRQDILLYNGLRHIRTKSVKVPATYLVIGLSSTRELLALNSSLQRIANWPDSLLTDVHNIIAAIGAQASQLSEKLLVPALW